MLPINSTSENSSTKINEKSKECIVARVDEPPGEGSRSPINLAPPSTLLGRTFSASAADCRGIWRNKRQFPSEKISTSQSSFSSSADGTAPIVPRIAGNKRKYSSQHDYSTISDLSRLPNFVNSLPIDTVNNSQIFRPTASGTQSEFVTPNQPKKQLSRPNSPSNANSRPILPRGRVASIRRESDCSTENEAAHEKLVKSAQQVSVGLEDFCLDDKLFEERKRAKSLTEPISIFTHAFLPQSSTPSPTRANVDTQKQCYSPSTQQVVRSNIPYSPSPSPTPGSPYNRMRSMSPIAVRQIAKRRYTASGGGTNGGGSNGNGSELESDGEGSSGNCLAPPAAKRQYTAPNAANASPLVRDSTANFHQIKHQVESHSRNPRQFKAASLTDEHTFTATSPVHSCASSGSFGVDPAVPVQHSSGLLVDPRITAQSFSSSSMIECQEEEDSVMAEEEGSLFMSSFCSVSAYDANSSTPFSSRANTPHSEMLDNSGTENDISALLFLPPPQLSCTSDDSSQSSLRMTDARKPSQQLEDEGKQQNE